MTPETIQIYLPDGNPKGIREAEMEARQVEVILMPKTDFLTNKDKVDFLGCYILVDTLTSDKPEVYIGKGLIKERVIQHIIQKPFWNFLFAFKLNSGSGFNESQTAYMERFFIQKARLLNQSILKENKQLPTERKLDKHSIACINKHLETIEILLSCLGLKIFQPLSDGKKADLFTIKNKSGNLAVGEVVEGGFFVHKGAKIRINHTNSFLNTSEYRYKKYLIEEGLLKQNGEFLILQEDHKFPSSTRAAGIILRTPSNGFTCWFNNKGVSLGDLYRNK